jgi:UDP-GlcNAc:undecaprenyl-phosphate GlcNAc-1-phosphate transferase
MRAGNTQVRTAVIMYLWTATIAFPVTVSAFAPLWVSAIFAGVLLAFTILFSRGKSKSYRGLASTESV